MAESQTVIVGLTGTVVLKDSVGATVTQRLGSIQVNTGKALFDVSAYGEEGWVERVHGIKDLAGSAAGFLTKGTTGADPFSLVDDVATMVITYDTNCYISFPAVIGNVQVSSSYSGLNIVTFDWAKATGAAPAVNWIETA